MFTESGRKTRFRTIYNRRLRGLYSLTLISVLLAPRTLIADVGFQKKRCRIFSFYSYIRSKQNTLYCSNTGWAWSVCIVTLSFGPLGLRLIVALIYTNICWIQQNFFAWIGTHVIAQIAHLWNWIFYCMYSMSMAGFICWSPGSCLMLLFWFHAIPIQ